MKELKHLQLVLQRTANNKNNSEENRQLAKEALDAVRETVRGIESRDLAIRARTAGSLNEVFGSTSQFADSKSEEE